MQDGQFRKMVKALYVSRDPKGIKSDFGRALLIGGCRRYPGAIVISALLASVSGNGYTAVSVPDSIYSSVASKIVPTQIFEFLSSEENFVSDSENDIERCLSTYDSILFGNGIAQTKENYDFMAYLLQNYHGYLVLDATALSLLAEYGCSVLDGNVCRNVLLTPHLGEASKLIGEKKGRNTESYHSAFVTFSREHHVNVLLKGYSSSLILTDGRILSSSYSPCAALGKAGSGDGLAGYITGLLSYAAKSFSYEDVILFADQMIHRAASEAGSEISSGLASILSCPDKIKEIISMY